MILPGNLYTNRTNSDPAQLVVEGLFSPILSPTILLKHTRFLLDLPKQIRIVNEALRIFLTHRFYRCLICTMATEASTDAAGEDLVCARATPKQITRHFENTSQMWAAPLSLPQYLHMQNQLAKSADNVATTQYWVLFKPSDPDTIMSSCSVYLREAIVNSGRGMEPVKAAVITDIFTHSEFRRNGMATRLLTKVKEALDGMEKERVGFSIIYSGVNTELYDRLG